MWANFPFYGEYIKIPEIYARIDQKHILILINLYEIDQNLAKFCGQFFHFTSILTKSLKYAAIDKPKFICYAYMWGKVEHYGELWRMSKYS